jgi:hypothetical protein
VIDYANTDKVASIRYNDAPRLVYDREAVCCIRRYMCCDDRSPRYVNVEMDRWVDPVRCDSEESAGRMYGLPWLLSHGQGR